MVYRTHIRNKGLVEFIKKRLKDRNLKANLNKIARSGEEYNESVTALIELLQNIYVAKGDPEKERNLEDEFDQFYGHFRDSEEGLKTGDWSSKEIELYIKGFLHRYSDILGNIIPRGDSAFDHATICAWIPTRCPTSLQTFKRTVMKNVKNKKKFTFQMYLEKLQELLTTRKEWEKYTSHYVCEPHARFANNKTNKLLVQWFKDDAHLFDDVDTRDEFIAGFVANLKEKKIRAYKYDHANVSFHLVAEEKLIKFFRTKFSDWNKRLKQGKL